MRKACTPKPSGKSVYAEENLSVEEEDPAGFACFEQSGEKMQSVWLKIHEEKY